MQTQTYSNLIQALAEKYALTLKFALTEALMLMRIFMLMLALPTRSVGIYSGVTQSKVICSHSHLT